MGGAQSGIRMVPASLQARCAMVATECVATGADWIAGTTTRGRMMRRIRNQGGSKRADEIRHRGRRSESPHGSVYVMTHWANHSGYQ